MTRSAEGQFLALALQGATPGDIAELPEAAARVQDWPLVIELAGRHRASPWLLSAISETGVTSMPPEWLEKLRSDAWAMTITALAMDRGLDEALTCFARAEIPVVVLKGRVVAELLYPDPALRPYTDMDLLVPLECGDTVDEVCRSLGYHLQEDHGGLDAPLHDSSEHAYERLYTHPERGLRLDVHFDHLQIGLKPAELAGVWERREPWTHQGVVASAPALPDLFLMLAVHLHRHGFDRLIWFKDLDLFVRRFGAELDWRQLEETAAAEGVSASLQQSLVMLRQILATPLPEGARRLARRTPATLIGSLFWRESDLYRPVARRQRWRRAVQFVPWDGVRGSLPSLLIMGRRAEKARALWRRLRSRSHVERGGWVEKP